ncbi:hypothetical protein K1719_000125 [Acacia pycnantha]|nr:hypothetical protein K1719_000125 [Acacia pycnantha]
MAPAFLPPPAYLSSRPLAPVEETEVRRVMHQLCKAVGVSHAYLHLRGEYVKSVGDVQRLTVDLNLAQEKAKRLAKERGQSEEAKEQALDVSRRAEEELRHTKSDLEQSRSELDSLKSAHLLEVESAKSLTQQNAVLAQELEDTRGDLDGMRVAYEKAAAMVKKAAEQCFRAALAQLQFLNPGVSLNVEGYDYHSYIKDGVLVPPPSSPEVGPISAVEAGHSEQAGGASTLGVEPDVDGSPEDEAAPPS